MAGDLRARAVGGYGERVAARHLRDAGMELLDLNWRCPRGEIDIVALDGDCLVVVEVKTRRGHAFGTPIEAVTRAKATRLRRLAGAWVQAHPSAAARARDIRIDVIGVTSPARGAALVTHLSGVA
jgi:putative endonuclease